MPGPMPRGRTTSIWVRVIFQPRTSATTAWLWPTKPRHYYQPGLHQAGPQSALGPPWKGDKFIGEDAAGGQLTDTNQIIDNTQGGALARDAVAQFLSMNVRMKETGSASYGGSPLESFMNRLLRPDDTALQLGATATGRAYDTKYKGPATETAQAGADAYWKATGENIVGNRKTSAETRASQLDRRSRRWARSCTAGTRPTSRFRRNTFPTPKRCWPMSTHDETASGCRFGGRQCYNQMAEHKRALQAMLVRYDQNVMNL